MDIHKPKPWHGVREFLKEYVIIVVGVLTALGAEQAVEWLHWRHEVHVAQETLKPEYLHLMEVIGRRDGQSPCIARRVDALAAILDQSAQTGRLPPIGLIGQPSRESWAVRGWEALVAGQVLQHMPPARGRSESSVAIMGDYVARERDVEVERWATLAPLMGSGRKLEPGELAAYRVSLGIAARQAGLMRASVDFMATDLMKTGVLTRSEAEAAWRKGVEGGRAWMICQPLGSSPIKLSAAQGNLADEPSPHF